MKKIVFIFFPFLFCSAYAQTVQTGMSPPLYFYPKYFKEKHTRSLYILEYYKVYKKKKIVLTKPFAISEFLFDESGVARKLVQHFAKNKSDTLNLANEDTVVDGQVVKKVERSEGGKFISITRFDGNESIRKDMAGNIVFMQTIKAEVESPTHVTREYWNYDSLGRPHLYSFNYNYLSFNYKKNNWDTVPLVKTDYIFHYNEIGVLISLEEKYISIQGVISTTCYNFTYENEEIIIRDKDDPTAQLPEKYYAILRKKIK